MTLQLSIFDAPIVRRGDPSTSHKAAQRALNFKAKHEAAIFAAIAEAGSQGATAKEISRATGLTDVQANRRLSAMGERGLIRRNGMERNGCKAWVKS